jgi:hypothetical protein
MPPVRIVLVVSFFFYFFFYFLESDRIFKFYEVKINSRNPGALPENSGFFPAFPGMENSFPVETLGSGGSRQRHKSCAQECCCHPQLFGSLRQHAGLLNISASNYQPVLAAKIVINFKQLSGNPGLWPVAKIKLMVVDSSGGNKFLPLTLKTWKLYTPRN